MRLLSRHALVAVAVLASGCFGRRQAAGRWPATVPAVRNASSREQLPTPDGGMVMFFRHSGPFATAFSGLVEDLTSGGWQILDMKGSLNTQAMSGCGRSCDELRFYAVTRRLGPRSVTILRTMSPLPPVELETPCESVELATTELDASSRYSPVYDVDLDRDGRLDAYVPRYDGEKIVWDAYAMRGACGHRVGTFDRMPADPHVTEMAATGLVDLTVSETVVDEYGREKRIPITYRFDGTQYVRPTPS